MAFLIGVLMALSGGAGASRLALRDVPLGECHGCEVTCFEDCSLKYEREILADDFIQLPVEQKNQTRKPTKIGQELMECLKEEECPCPKEDAKKAANGTALLQKNSTCAVQEEGAAGCAQTCAKKVVNRAHTKLEKKKAVKTVAKKQVFLEKDYPIHSVTVGTFSRGAMNMDECLKFCLAATCGCDKAPGLDTIDKLFKAIKANDAAMPGEKDFEHHDHPGTAVADTKGSYKYRAAKIEECAKGMVGKKVSKGLYIDFGGSDKVEICGKKMLERIFGPGDHSNKEKLCQSTKSDDSKWGCIWNEKKGYCGVGFSPNLRCQKKYINDPSPR